MHLRLSLLGSLFAISLAACNGRVSLGPDPDPEGTDSGLEPIDAAVPYDGGVDPEDAATHDGQVQFDSGLADVPDVNAPRCAATCSDPAGPATTYGSMADVVNDISGVWTRCSGHIVGPADAIGLELDPAASKAYYLVADGAGKPVRGQGEGYELTVVILDSTMMNGPGSYQINLSTGGGERHFYSTYSECPRKLQLRDATTGDSADFAGNDAPQTQACSLVGTWDLTQSDNGSRGVFQFASDDSFIGGPAGSSLPQGKTFGGQYEMSPSNLMTLASSYGMGCGYSATYQATFDASCNSVALHELTDGCTGAREYLHIDQTLTRTK